MFKITYNHAGEHILHHAIVWAHSSEAAKQEFTDWFDKSVVVCGVEDIVINVYLLD